MGDLLETDETTDVNYYRPSYWRVLAVTEAGSSPPSNVVHVPLRVASAPRLSTPDPVNSSGQVQLSWLPPANDFGSDITEYVIEQSPNGTSGWVSIARRSGTATSYTVTGLTTGTTYYFRLFAVNAAGSSPASNIVTTDPSSKPVLSAPRALSWSDYRGTDEGYFRWLPRCPTVGCR